MKGVYNPFSLLNTLKKQDVQDYWFRTGTPTYLIRLLQHFNENLNENRRLETSIKKNF